MGRLEHLKRTLPTQFHPDCESIVVDWSCPDKCGDWVENNFPDVKVIRVLNQKTFHHARSRNVGFEHAIGEFTCQADADLIVEPSFFDLLQVFDNDHYYVNIPTSLYADPTLFVGKRMFKNFEERKKFAVQTTEPITRWKDSSNNIVSAKSSLTGFIVAPTSSIQHVGGMSNEFEGYGYNDIDLRVKLLLNERLNETVIDQGHLDSIEHSDQLRIEHLGKNIDKLFDQHITANNLMNTKWKKLEINWRAEVLRLLN